MVKIVSTPIITGQINGQTKLHLNPKQPKKKYG